MNYLDIADRIWPLTRRAMGVHTLVYRLTGGLIGRTFPGGPEMLLLDHVGAKTGKKRTSPLLGLGLFGAGESLLVASTLGNSPWPVFAQGVARQTGTSVGVATIVTSVGVLCLWVPLRQRPGLGTILNALLIGLAIDATLAV